MWAVTRRELRRSILLQIWVLMQLAKHPLTDIGIEKFLEDWEKVRTSEQGP